MKRRGFIRLSLWICCLLPALPAPGDARAQPILNEIIAANTVTYADEDGDFEDWVEIFNPGPETLLLTGYGLSDDPLDPLRWRFPQTELRPGKYMVVFASGKDRTEPYVAYWETCIDWGDLYRFKLGFSEPPADWMQPDHDDGNWFTGATGIGYGDNDDDTVIPVNSLTCYVRREFQVEDTDPILYMALHVDYDDAFVAYLNGVEVARANIGTPGVPPPHDQPADSNGEANLYRGRDPAEFLIGEYLHLLREGTNVLAVQVHNTYGSSDMSLIPFLSLGFDEKPPFPTGVADAIEHLFSKLHTNFQIEGSGEELILSDPEGTTVDSVFTGLLLSDISTGRQPDAGPDWFLFDAPSPERPNSGPAFPGYTSPPVFSAQGGLFDGPLSLTLQCYDPEALIHWTTDGALPSESSPVYEGEILLSQTTAVRARAFAPGKLPSMTQTHSYIIDESPTLPVISLTTDPANLWDEDSGIYVIGSGGDPEFPHDGANFWQDWERPVHVEFYETDGAPAFRIPAGMKIFGGMSRTLPQKSLRIIARSGYGASRMEHRIFPDLEFDEYKQVILRNSGQDWNLTLLRDGVMHRMGRNLDVDLQAYRPAMIFLNGEYWGILNLRERQNEHYLYYHHGVDPDSLDLMRWPDEVINGSHIDYEDLIHFIDNHPLGNHADYLYVASKIDIPSFIDYNVLQIYCGNMDWPGANTKMWRPWRDGGRWRYLVFDMDAGLGLDWLEYGPETNTLAFAIDRHYPENTFPLRALLDNVTFRREFVNAFADHMNTSLNAEVMHEIVDEAIATVDPEMPRHQPRWEFTYDRWLQKIPTVRDYIDDRREHVQDHIMSQFGLGGMFELDLAVDPPAAGSIELGAVTVQPPFRGEYFLGNPVGLGARAAPGYVFAGWSDPGLPQSPDILLSAQGDTSLTARFVPYATVVINEINYNSADGFDPDDWVEFHNTGEESVELGGWRFKDSADEHSYQFPPGAQMPAGGYLVLCRDIAAFHLLFPEVTNALGNMDFGLSGDGELIRLYDDQDQLVDWVQYDDEAPWPTQPDGGGPTLELVDPAADNSLAENWRASYAHGSPGQINSVLGSAADPGPLPAELSLLAPYPNPFNPTTTLRYGLPARARVLLEIFDVRGRLVERLRAEHDEAGWHELSWNASEHASGVYLLRLKTERQERRTKMLLLK